MGRNQLPLMLYAMSFVPGRVGVRFLLVCGLFMYTNSTWQSFGAKVRMMITSAHNTMQCTVLCKCAHEWAFLVTSPPEGVARYCFHPACLCVSVCLCVRPIFWYFISRLLEEISIWNLYRILIGLFSIHWKIDLHRSMVKVTGTVHWFLKVQSYHNFFS